MKNWYKIISQKAHIGSGKHIDCTLFVYAADSIEALKKYRVVRGIKRDLRNYDFFPEVTKLNDNESSELEKEIKQSLISLKKAKRKWYLPDYF